MRKQVRKAVDLHQSTRVHLLYKEQSINVSYVDIRVDIKVMQRGVYRGLISISPHLPGGGDACL